MNPKIDVSERKHPTCLTGYVGDNFSLGVELGRMRYDKLQEVLEGLKSEIDSQAKNDLARKRSQLSKLLKLLSGELSQVIISTERIFTLCKPYLKKELEAGDGTRDA